MLFLSWGQMVATSLLASTFSPASIGLLSWARKFKYDIRQPEMLGFCFGFFLVLSCHKNMLQIKHCFSWLGFMLAYQIVTITTSQNAEDIFTDR